MGGLHGLLSFCFLQEKGGGGLLHSIGVLVGSALH